MTPQQKRSMALMIRAQRKSVAMLVSEIDLLSKTLEGKDALCEVELLTAAQELESVRLRMNSLESRFFIESIRDQELSRN